MRERARQIAVLRYGFQFRKTDVTERTMRDSVDAVIARTKSQVEHSSEPLSAVIQGVDDAWEVCLLKFTIDLIERSSGGNIGDLRKRGLALSALVTDVSIAPHQFEKPKRVAHRMDAADFIGVDVLIGTESMRQPLRLAMISISVS